MNQTKIIATITKDTCNYDTLKQIIIEGCDVIRINNPYLEINFINQTIELVRKIENELKTNIGIMIETSGPVLRIEKIKYDEVELIENKKIKIYNYPVLCNDTQISLNYNEIVDELDINDTLYIDNIILTVESVNVDYVICNITSGGILKSYQPVIIKDKHINMQFLNSEDLKTLKYAINNDIDFIGLSYVRDELDVQDIVDIIISEGNDHLQVISKIETPSSINNLEEIIKISDGIIIDRCDLEKETTIEKLPYYQKLIINKCYEYEKVSIIATDLNISVENQMTPSRAEVSDIYNAVMDKCDAIILGKSSSFNKYPIETVKSVSKILVSAEEDFNYEENLKNIEQNNKIDITSTISSAVVESSLKLNTNCIITNTNSGYTAMKIAHSRPKCNILAMSPSKTTLRKLSIIYGVVGILTEECKSTDTIVKMCLRESIKKLNLKTNDIVIITGGFPISNKNTNFMKIEIIE